MSSADSLEAAPCLFGRSDLVHASTAELLLGLGRFVAEHAAVRHFDAAQLVMWLRAIDRSLMLQVGARESQRRTVLVIPIEQLSRPKHIRNVSIVMASTVFFAAVVFKPPRKHFRTDAT